jgi:hypothetical protein
MNAKQECDCYICRDQLDFELDDFLLDEIERGNVVIFAGSGVSTENRLSSPHTLYTDIAHRLGLSGTELAFPDLMQKFAERPDGQFELFRLIQQRFDRISFFQN